jgi:hypothetical protein
MTEKMRRAFVLQFVLQIRTSNLRFKKDKASEDALS